MSPLRESVTVKTPVGDLHGELFIGADGLPGLEVLGGGYHEKGCYTPATFPNVWRVLMDIDSSGLGPLFHAWRDIEDVRRVLQDAQRESDAEDRDRARQRESDARTAMELDERREG